MLTKEEFTHEMDFIKKHYDMENKLCEALEAMAPGEYINAFIYNDYQYELVKMIKRAMGLADDNSDLEYFMIDCEFGKAWKPGMLTDDGKDVDFSSADKVYDYLTAEK